jgi:hypothetical protein
MADELTKEETERRASEVAHRLMNTPYRKQEWPGAAAKKAKAPASRSGGAASPRAAKPRHAGR